MNTYDNSNDISGLDWQTAFNRSSSAPSFRETMLFIGFASFCV